MRRILTVATAVLMATSIVLSVGTPGMAPASAQSASPAPGFQSAANDLIGETATLPRVFPRLLAEVPLAPADTQPEDLALDTARGRLYVTDGAGHLHVLQADSLAEVATLPGHGLLTLDTNRNRLYASTRDGQEGLTVLDTASLKVVGTISPGGQLAIDPKRGRLYVGNPQYTDPTPGEPGVRVYDAGTLQRVGEIGQPGLPLYNALRDELVIVAYTAYLADPETLVVTQDLLPDITAQSLRWCNGCEAAVNAHLFPERGLLLVQMTTLSPGKGPGTFPPHRYFDAATLEQITDASARPPVERCGDHMTLGEPVRGRVYRGELYSRYETFNNLLVYDLDGNLLTWRDGLSLGVTNPRTNQMYVYHGDDVLVLDLDTLSPLGALPTGCIHTVDPATGLLYGLGMGKLSVFAETGGQPRFAPTSPVGGLPAGEISAIWPSPGYPEGGTLFVAHSGRLYRSFDGGTSWDQLRGGLPEGEYLALYLAVSPNFATDQTLFVGGLRGSFWGEGVYRSTDGGDTWQPVWNGLTHLRVYQVAISPNYAADKTLIAYARYQRINPSQNGLSVFRSTDAGTSWSLLMAQPGDQGVPAPSDLLPASFNAAGFPPPTMRARGYAQGVERTFDGGSTWQPVLIPGQSERLVVKAVLASPDPAEAETYYVVGEANVWRTPDRGQTWQRCGDARLAGRDDLSRRLTAAAVSSYLGARMHYWLYIGTGAGELMALSPVSAPWEDLTPRPKPPKPTDTPTLPPPSPSCRLAPTARFAGLYADPNVAARLGCAVAAELSVWGAYEPFERGAMIWLGDVRTISVLEARGVWMRYPDTWDDTQPASDPALTPPSPLQQPVRGFGKVWREQLGGPRSALGWALSPEAGLDITRQEFERGSVLFGPQGATYVLYADGGWERR